MKGNFQIILLVIFVVGAILGVLVLSGAIPINKNKVGGVGSVVLWGTMPSSLISPVLRDLNDNNPNFTINYVQKSVDTFDQDLLEALAGGVGPDLFFLPDNLIYHYADKVVTIPYTSYPLATFKSTFAGAGEVFLASRGVSAFPIFIDPLMMYYNRSILDSNEIVYPPSTWDELVDMVPVLTKKDDSNKITKSTISFGHFSNVVHAKDILAALFMQTGNPLVKEKDGVFVSSLDSSYGNRDLASILKFYTDFADSNNSLYSWNKSFPDSDDLFSKEDLVFYFGFASELESLIKKNPNQNFFVAGIPQIKNSKFKLTGAHVTGIAISSFSKNFEAAFAAANLMSSSDFAPKLALALGVAPARRDLLSSKQTDAYSPIFYSSALYAKSWLDPSQEDTDKIFSAIINGVLSNSMSASAAIKDAHSRMSLLLLK